MSQLRGLRRLAPLSFGLALLCISNLDAQHPGEGAILVGKRDRLQLHKYPAHSICRCARAECIKASSA